MKYLGTLRARSICSPHAVPGARAGHRCVSLRRLRGFLLGAAIALALSTPCVARADASEAAAARPADAADETARLPNVLLISLDTTRADFLTFMDPETSEHMAALAERGTIFTQAISGSSWTLPSHAQMFTGMAPPYHGTESSDVAIDPLFPVLPEILRDHGFYTAGVYTVRYLLGEYGFSRGFDFYRLGLLSEDLLHAGRDDRRLDRRGVREERQRQLMGRDYVSSENVVGLIRMGLEGAPVDRPVFLFAHFFDPHHDWVPPPPWDTRFDPDYDGPIDGRNLLENVSIVDFSTPRHRRVDDRGLEHLKALYRGEIAWTDQAVGRILDLLELHRRLDDTLIIVTADHGEEFFEHDKLTHRFNLFDETIRVPLLIVLPKRWREGAVSRVDAQVSLSDILPTIVDYLGIELPPGITGRSLRPAIEGDAFASRPELISLYITKDPLGGIREHMQTYGLRTPEWKFFRAVIMLPGEPVRVQGQFYDLVRDPHEQQPVLDPRDPRVRAHWALLEEELDRARAAWREDPRSPRNARTTTPSAETIAELRALGYLDESVSADPAAMRRPWGLQPMDPIPLAPTAAQLLGVVFAAAALLLGLVVAVWRIRRRRARRRAGG